MWTSGFDSLRWHKKNERIFSSKVVRNLFRLIRNPFYFAEHVFVSRILTGHVVQ